MAEGLDRFTDAQARVWETVKAELQAGRKSSHWMWYIFPQLESLGQSPTAKHYGIRDIDEASAYLAHPVLGPRLAEVAGLLLPHAGTPPERIMGGVDAMKLRSSMTLFSMVPEADPVFAQVLATFYTDPCPLTVEALSGHA